MFAVSPHQGGREPRASGTKSNGYIAKTAYYAAKSVVEAAADGSLFVADIAIAEALPERGSFIGAPNEESGE